MSLSLDTEEIFPDPRGGHRPHVLHPSPRTLLADYQAVEEGLFELVEEGTP